MNTLIEDATVMKSDLIDALYNLTEIKKHKMNVLKIVQYINNNKILLDDLFKKYPTVKDEFYSVLSIANDPKGTEKELKHLFDLLFSAKKVSNEIAVILNDGVHYYAK